MLSEVFNCDCMEYMRDIPDKFFELAIVDPPYGINGKNNRLTQGRGKLKNNILNNSNCEWDRTPPDENYFKELFRVSKNQIIWGGNYFKLPPSRCIVVWDKVQVWENFSQCEIAWTSFDKPAKLYRQMNAGANSEKKIHPTQKPVELYKYLLAHFANKGDKILDTHLGSGSSRIAAWEYGFDFFGCEKDKKYFEDMEKRFLKFKEQQLLDFGD